MKLISRDELKQMIDQQQDFRLVFALSVRAFEETHIPGSIHVDSLTLAEERLDRADRIVVYCASPHCPASVGLYQLLVQAGYADVRRYAGGLEDWEEAGYALVSQTSG